MVMPQAAEMGEDEEEELTVGRNNAEATWMRRSAFVECGGENVMGVIQRQS